MSLSSRDSLGHRCKSDKVTDPGNKFYSAFKELEENLVFKFAWSAKCSQPLKPERDTDRLSRDLVRLLRWNLPKLGIAYSRYDGSVRIAGAARYFHVPEGKIIDATTSSTKVRIVIFQRLSLDINKVRIGACSGHGFCVYAPPGHCLVEKTIGHCHIAPLMHETAHADLIIESNFLSAMDREGGVNFNPRISGGYRPRAEFEAIISETELAKAIKNGIQFFENRFSGLVYGVGAWNQGKGWWDGKIPREYVKMCTRK